MIDKTFNRLGVGLGLFLMVCELTYINSKSLLYLVPDTMEVDKIFAVVGSLAFSLVTIVVMRKPGKMALKIFFPVFDTLLVVCGFNLKFAQAILDGSDNPVRFWLTIFLGLFTGLITYSLGIINYEEQTSAVSSKEEEYKQNWYRVSKDLDQANKELKLAALQLKENAATSTKLAGEVDHYRSELQAREAELKDWGYKMQELEKFRQQVEARCVCRYCKQSFTTEAAKRSHEGRCTEKNK